MQENQLRQPTILSSPRAARASETMGISSLLSTSVISGLGPIWDRQFGFLKQTLVAPATRTLIMIERTIGGAAVSAAQALITMIICLVAEFRPISIRTLPMALVLYSGSLWCSVPWRRSSRLA